MKFATKLIPCLVLTMISSIAIAQWDMDTLGTYDSFGVFNISNHNNTLVYRTTFAKKTISVKTFYSNKRLAKEIIQYSDSTYLYQDFYEESGQDIFQKTGICGDQRLCHPNYNYGTKKKGLLKKTDIRVDSFLVFDPINYAEITDYSYLLIPTSKWEFYHSRSGCILESGSFNEYGKHGEWQYFDFGGELKYMEEYRNGELIKTE